MFTGKGEALPILYAPFPFFKLLNFNYMKFEFKNHCLCVTREEGDPKYYGLKNGAGESKLLHAIKNELNKQGYDLIKKRSKKLYPFITPSIKYLFKKNICI